MEDYENKVYRVAEVDDPEGTERVLAGVGDAEDTDDKEVDGDDHSRDSWHTKLKIVFKSGRKVI